MWTAETRAEHDRDDLRYPSDLTDAEWQILAPLATACGDRPASVLADARSDECDLLCAARRLSVAHAAGAFPAAPDDLSLVHPAPRRRNVGSHSTTTW
jgi:hypothetical protein